MFSQDVTNIELEIHYKLLHNLSSLCKITQYRNFHKHDFII